LDKVQKLGRMKSSLINSQTNPFQFQLLTNCHLYYRSRQCDPLTKKIRKQIRFDSILLMVYFQIIETFIITILSLKDFVCK
jgi:hypothetical protein